MGFMTNLRAYGTSERGLVQHAVREAYPPTDILIHVSESLDEGERYAMLTAVEEIEGVLSAKFTPQRWPLLTVWYDADRTSSRAIIDKLQGHNVHVQLIGPV